MTEASWGPRPAAFAVGGVLLAVGIVWLIVAGDNADRVVAVAVMVAVLAMMLAGYRMRIRLAASPSGIVVGTLSGQRRIPWSAVRRIEVISRRRMGTLSQSLEIDLDDDGLLVFGRMDLGVEPSAVADTLSQIRTGTA